MPNVVILYDRGQDHAIMQTLFSVSKNLPKDWKVHVISFFKERPDFGFDCKFTYIYDSPIFSRKLSGAEIEEAESWLRYPFRLLLKGNPFYSQELDKAKHPEFLAKLTYFWRDFISSNEIGAFLAVLESMYPSTVGFETSKRMGVQTIHLSVSRLGGAAMLLDESLLPIFYKKLTDAQIGDGYKKVADAICRASKPVKMDLAKKRGKFYMPDLEMHSKRSLDYWLKWPEGARMTYPSPYVLTLRKFIREARRKVVPLFYRKPDFKRKFFIYPLSFADEAYNSYFNGMFDQYEMVRIVARALPGDHLLYVKPHPHYCGNDIPISKAREMAGLPNVRLVPHGTGFRELLEGCSGITTISATTGFEGIVHGKPVIVFGKPFYAAEGTVIPATDLMRLPQILAMVAEDPGYGIDPEKRRELVGKYYAHQIPIESKPSSNLNFTVNDSEAKRIAEGVVAAYAHLKERDRRD